MSPLEKMARAICRAELLLMPKFREPGYEAALDACVDDDWEASLPIARAALLAIREPDREVTQAMDAESYPDSGSYTRWQAGIDAILNQEPRP